LREEVRVALSEFNGHDLVNIRVWAEPRDGGPDKIPTKAGLALRVEKLPELIEALEEAERQAREAGLISGDTRTWVEKFAAGDA
jgi:hypothetical protein